MFGYIDKPSLCIFNALGFAFQRFPESGWLPNKLAEYRISGIFVCYWCKGVMLKLIYAIKKYIYTYVYNGLTFFIHDVCFTSVKFIVS